LFDKDTVRGVAAVLSFQIAYSFPFQIVLGYRLLLAVNREITATTLAYRWCLGIDEYELSF